MKRLLFMLLSVLGLVSCDKINDAINNEQPLMYGSPTMEFRISGKITDLSGNPLEGIAAEVDFGFLRDTVYSSATGEYSYVNQDVGTTSKVCITAMDITDGKYAENENTVNISSSDFEGKSGWFSGTVTKSLDIVMEEKTEE